ncbi:hypothetical protein EPI10_000870 [Gossypium australe]|uniref:Uncharacterized protein n=1 Tax=Gossypium australe TaxID=47621 RepID=A0A5B6V9B4_9ROSI|nr:hypothetical protein EPI10_000870 [Gossypium australe]
MTPKERVMRYPNLGIVIPPTDSKIQDHLSVRDAQPPQRDQPIGDPRVEIQPAPHPPMEQCTLHDYVMPNLDVVQGSINRPKINDNNFEIKLKMIQMI